MRDYRPCAYYGSVADSYSWQHCYVGAQPGILSNRDRTVVEDALQPFNRVNRMIGADQAAPRAYQGAMANGDDVGIEERAVQVHKSHPLEVYVLAHDTLETRFHEQVFIVTFHQFAQDFLASRR